MNKAPLINRLLLERIDQALGDHSPHLQPHIRAIMSHDPDDPGGQHRGASGPRWSVNIPLAKAEEILEALNQIQRDRGALFKFGQTSIYGLVSEWQRHVDHLRSPTQ